jgi:hypothetical protein
MSRRVDADGPANRCYVTKELDMSRPMGIWHEVHVPAVVERVLPNATLPETTGGDVFSISPYVQTGDSSPIEMTL